jgi:hypothetical protein
MLRMRTGGRSVPACTACTAWRAAVKLSIPVRSSHLLHHSGRNGRCVRGSGSPGFRPALPARVQVPHSVGVGPRDLSVFLELADAQWHALAALPAEARELHYCSVPY